MHKLKDRSPNINQKTSISQSKEIQSAIRTLEYELSTTLLSQLKTSRMEIASATGTDETLQEFNLELT